MSSRISGAAASVLAAHMPLTKRPLNAAFSGRAPEHLRKAGDWRSAAARSALLLAGPQQDRRTRLPRTRLGECGHPGRRDMQESVLRLALEMLETAPGPHTSMMAPFAWKEEGAPGGRATAALIRRRWPGCARSVTNAVASSRPQAKGSFRSLDAWNTRGSGTRIVCGVCFGQRRGCVAA